MNIVDLKNGSGTKAALGMQDRPAIEFLNRELICEASAFAQEADAKSDGKTWRKIVQHAKIHLEKAGVPGNLMKFVPIEVGFALGMASEHGMEVMRRTADEIIAGNNTLISTMMRSLMERKTPTLVVDFTVCLDAVCRKSGVDENVAGVALGMGYAVKSN